MRFYRNLIILLIILSAFLLPFLFSNRIYHKEYFIFDTFVEIKFFSRNILNARKTIKEIQCEFKIIDSLCSSLIEKDIKNRIISEIISVSKDISLQTDGAFDVTIGIISKLWNRFKEPVLPDTQEILKKLNLVDYRRITIHNDSVFISNGQIIDIGGIAKGYAIKVGIDIMKKNNIKSGMINAGGDIGLLGNKNGSPWKIGLRDPFNKNAILDTLFLENTSVATSGDYERYFELNGKRYHHILNPKTGYPTYTFRSVTVIFDNPIYADAYATAIFVLGEEGIKFANEHNLKVIIITYNKEILRINI